MTCHRNARNNVALLIKKDSPMRLARRPFPVINRRSAASRFSDQHKTPAADVSGAGPSNGQRQTYGDSGVNGITASLQNFYSDFRGELIRRSHHAMLRTDGRIRQRLAKRLFRKGRKGLTEKYETSEGESHYGPLVHFFSPPSGLARDLYHKGRSNLTLRFSGPPTTALAATCDQNCADSPGVPRTVRAILASFRCVLLGSTHQSIRLRMRRSAPLSHREEMEPVDSTFTHHHGKAYKDFEYTFHLDCQTRLARSSHITGGPRKFPKDSPRCPLLGDSVVAFSEKRSAGR